MLLLCFLMNSRLSKQESISTVLRMRNKTECFQKSAKWTEVDRCISQFLSEYLNEGTVCTDKDKTMKMLHEQLMLHISILMFSRRTRLFS
jgi:hypothetical protein